MSRSALLDLIPGARRKLVWHEQDGRAFIETRQDVEGIVEAARIVADQPPGRDFRHAAYIPDVVLEQAFREGWFHDPAAWKRWANDPANAAFRTWKGRL
jgi:hypothetical protein